MTKRELKIMIMEEVLKVLEEKDLDGSDSALDSLVTEEWHQKFQEKMKDQSFAKRVGRELDQIFESDDLKYIHNELSGKIPNFSKNFQQAKTLMGEAVVPNIDGLLTEGDAWEMIKSGAKAVAGTAVVASLLGIATSQLGSYLGITEPALLGKLVAGFVGAVGGFAGLSAIAAGGTKKLVEKFKQYAQKAQGAVDQAGAQPAATPTV